MKSKKSLISLIAVVLAVAAVILFFPRAWGEQYSAGSGETSAKIKNLAIEWTSGAVHLEYYGGSTIQFTEKADGPLSEDQRMHWRVEGDTLRILYDKPGFRLFSFNNPKKELTVKLPQDLTLNQAQVGATSGLLDIPTLRAENIQLEITSGEIRATLNGRRIQCGATSGSLNVQVLGGADEVKIDATSGAVALDCPGNVNQCVIHTTSGSVQAAVKQAEECRMDSTSGNIQALIGSIKKTNLHSTSGRITVEALTVNDLDIHTTSGSVTAYLPGTPGFTARIDTTSGRFDSSLSMTKDGNQYICGDGSASVVIGTTSGNILVAEKEN